MRNDPVKTSLLNMLLLLIIVYMISIPFFMHYEGFTPLDAFYLTSMTITTVGYGDLVPQTDEGKVFCVLLAFAGISIIFYHITHIGQFRERTIDPHFKSQINMLRNLTNIYGIGKRDVQKLKRKIR